MIEISQIFISPGHNFIGRHGQPALDRPTIEVAEVECVTGMGLRGDRYFGHAPDYKGQVTLLDEVVCSDLRRAFGTPHLSAAVLRRNLLVNGVDLNALIGVTFRVQGITLQGIEECRPCYWMDTVVAPGAEAWLRGRGGLRCKILSDGWFRRQPHA